VEILGTASSNVHVAGSVRRPEVEMSLDIQRPAAFGEQIDRVRADARYRLGELDIANGIATDGTSELRFSGNYRIRERSEIGRFEFDMTAQNVAASRLEHVAKLSRPWTVSGREAERNRPDREREFRAYNRDRGSHREERDGR